MEKIYEMASVMWRAVKIDDEVSNTDHQVITQLELENKAMRELLLISSITHLGSESSIQDDKETQTAYYDDEESFCDADVMTVRRKTSHMSPRSKTADSLVSTGTIVDSTTAGNHTTVESTEADNHATMEATTAGNHTIVESTGAGNHATVEATTAGNHTKVESTAAGNDITVEFAAAGNHTVAESTAACNHMTIESTPNGISTINQLSKAMIDIHCEENTCLEQIGDSIDITNAAGTQ